MTKEVLEVIAGAGIGTLICVLAGYLWLKKAIQDNIVEPMIAPLRVKVANLETNHQDIKASLAKIEDNLSNLTNSVAKLSAVFDIISRKIDITIKK